jgi:hypothetical protein
VSDVVEVRLAASEIANEVERGAETRRPSPALTCRSACRAARSPAPRPDIAEGGDAGGERLDGRERQRSVNRLPNGTPDRRPRGTPPFYVARCANTGKARAGAQPTLSARLDRVPLRRRQHKDSMGNGGEPGLVRWDRRHWHCMEETNAPPHEGIG